MCLGWRSGKGSIDRTLSLLLRTLAPKSVFHLWSMHFLTIENGTFFFFCQIHGK